jgi:hypothetical protein
MTYYGGLCERCNVNNDLNYCKKWDMWLCENCEIESSLKNGGFDEEE